MVFQLRSMLYSFSVGCYCYLLEAESSGSRFWCDWEGGNYLNPYHTYNSSLHTHNPSICTYTTTVVRNQLSTACGRGQHENSKFPMDNAEQTVSFHAFVQYAKGVADASACPILSLLFIAASRLFCLPCTVLYDDNNDGNKDCCPARLDHRVL